jgi:hypothetical protein
VPTERVRIQQTRPIVKHGCGVQLPVRIAQHSHSTVESCPPWFRLQRTAGRIDLLLNDRLHFGYVQPIQFRQWIRRIDRIDLRIRR